MSGGTSGGVWVSCCVCVSSYEYLSRYKYEANARGRTIILSTKGDQGIYGERQKSEGARLDRRRVAKVNYSKGKHPQGKPCGARGWERAWERVHMVLRYR